MRRLTLVVGVLWLSCLWTGAATKAGRETGQPITSLSRLLSEKTPATLAGQRVELSNVPVQHVLNRQVILVGAPQGPQLVVRTQQQIARLKPGQMVDITGIIDQMPVTTQGWELPGKESQQLRGKEIYVNATKVRAHSQ